MLPHDLQIGGGIHPKLCIEMVMLFIVHAGQFYMLCTVRYDTLFDFAEKRCAIAFVLILGKLE